MLSAGRGSGVRTIEFVALTPWIRDQVETWFRSGRVPDAEVIRPGRLYRWRSGEVDFAAKFFLSRDGLRGHLRSPTALRVAREHERLKPVRTPVPWLAAWGPSRPGSSLLLYEFVAGAHLTDLWGESEEAVQAFPCFLAELHRRRIHHGDPHLHNSVWDGSSWVLLDLDGLRHPLRTLASRRLVEDEWARVWFALDAHRGAEESEVRELFATYARSAGWRHDLDETWERILGVTRKHWQEAIEGGTAAAAGIRTTP